MTRFHCLQHVPFETPGHIEDWIQEKGHRLSTTRLFVGDKMPAYDDFDVLIIMGGSMSVHEEDLFPWLKEEKAFLNEAIRLDKKVLGICLGAQLLAEALGANIFTSKEKEIGFMPVFLSSEGRATGIFEGLPDKPIVFHWHGETFDLPPAAICLAGSEACANQAFLYGSSLIGLQFHFEVTPVIVREMVKHDGGELKPSRYVQSEDQITGSLTYLDENKKQLFQFLDNFFVNQ
jgi:GMP synthase-like glutamine amidotransferase